MIAERSVPVLVAFALLVATSATPTAPGAASAAPSANSSGTADAIDAIEKTAELGPVRAVVRLQPAAPTIGDAVTLTLEVVAEDGIELSMPEFGQSLDRFTVREFVPKEGVDDQGRTLATQRYLLELPLSGPQAIPPLLIEFVDRRPGQKPAPEGEDAYELVTERIPFEVASVLPSEAGAELKPLRGAMAPLREPTRLWPWLLALAALAAAAAPYLWRRAAAARAEHKRRSAYEVARARLDALSQRTRPKEQDEIDAFFVELTALIRRYLEDRFEIRAPELTTEEFLQVASASPDIRETHQKFLQGFLRSADLVKFARFTPSPEDIAAALGAAAKFLDETAEVRAGDAASRAAAVAAQAKAA